MRFVEEFYITAYKKTNIVEHSLDKNLDNNIY